MNPRHRHVSGTAALTALLLTFFSGIVLAYPTYDGCKDCHGGFEDNNYISKQDGARWNQSLMDGHETFVGDECDACHKAGGRGEVYLNLSRDTSLSKSCVGCHGRQEDVNGLCVGGSGAQVECGGGAGLRQMHDTQVGAGTCGSCHSSDPAPVGEHISPYNYGRSGVLMSNSCDTDGTESQFGNTGLDNDGNGQRDSDDSNCAVNSPPTQPGTLSASAVTTSSAAVSWGASSDADGDAISYQVDYRQNGAVSWSNGGSTSATSRTLSGLAADTSYDVRVTPNDGTEDGPDRTALNLFLTDQAAPATCLDQGALAYDDWTDPDAGGSGALPADVQSVDYIRCKSCHGWDRMGMDGGYHRRSREPGRPNAGAGDTDQTSRNISLAARQGVSVTVDMVLHAGSGRLFSEGAGSWVDLDGIHSADNKAMHSHGYTLGNQHPDFSGGALTQQQLDCLVEFLNSPAADHSAYFSDIDPRQDPVLYTMVPSADASAGESYYGAHCQSCHGEPDQGAPANGPDGGILAYLDGDGKFSEFAHKARWGIPGTAMNREAMGSPAAADVANMMLWLQEIGQRGFAINPGLSGTWWGGPDRSGEGFLIDVAHNFMGDTILVVSFYTYDAMGNQVWLIGSGTAAGNTAEVTLVMPVGAMWGEDFSPGDRVETPWGSGTFTFTSCDSGRMALAPNTEMQNNFFTALEYTLSRDILIPGIECPTPTAVD